MEDDRNEYMRVGTTFYKYVNRPNLNNTFDKILVPWTKDTIIQDYGKDFLQTIPKFDGFISIPSHMDYQLSLNGFRNNYHEVTGPILKGEFPYIKGFMEHLFKEQINLAYDYLSLLWQKPLQILPVLSLVSEDKHTGKTTFLWLLKMLFQNNAVFIEPDALRSNFNANWVEKLLIIIDEAHFNKPQDSDKIKRLSTSTSFNLESKGVNRVEVPFYGKVIMGSNHINDFILIDKNEIRYWVVEVEKPKQFIENFEDKLESELPAFKYFIQNRKLSTQKKSRMWFTKEQLHTKALERVVKGTRVSLENDLKIILLNLFDNYERDRLNFTLSELVNLVKQDHVRASMSQIKNIVEDKWLLQKTQSTTYKFYAHRYCELSKKTLVDEIPKKGRVYTFDKSYIESL